MEKTYWRQLIDLAPQVENKGSIINVLYEDSCRRVSTYLFDHEEEANLENGVYAKKNLEFVKELLSIK